MLARTTLPLFTALAVSALTTPVDAQAAGPLLQGEDFNSDNGGDKGRSSSDGDLDFYFAAQLGLWTDTLGDGTIGEVDLTVLAPRFDLEIGFGRGFGVGAVLPIAYASASADGVEDLTATKIGNPLIKGILDLDLPVFDLKTSVGFTIPAATISDDDPPEDRIIGFFAYSVAAALDGFGELWLYAPDTFTIVVDAQLSANLAIVELRADAAIASMVSTSDNSETEVPVRLGVDALFGLFPGLSAGLRLQTTYLTIADNQTQDGGTGDQFQATLAPLLELDIGPVFARAKFNIHLDGPAGFSFDDNRVWGLMLAAGVDI